MDRYHLGAPAFSGEEDVEQFITTFSDVAAICRWPVKVSLIQLWLCLTGAAKPYGIGQDVGDIFVVLGSPLEMCVSNSKGSEEILRLSLQEHATMVERLAQVAYSDLPADDRQSLALDAFLQSIKTWA